ncbi:YbaB/EbfC family nucleoid-associated protein [Actinoplanes sp. HUAS TT8]|uniref:YbaB/EbfC family nucleoid-associated protein n=1 Tax=Actinoplanes sp. HUAS TT8 TaxID=3447453 RepID=UPI003F51FA04
MSDDHRLETMFEEYQRQRLSLTELHQRVQAIRATASSPRREIDVTVNHGGSVTDITFQGTAYRKLAPKDLSALILKTIDDAKAKAVTEAAELLAPMMPPGMNARELLAGSLGLDRMVPADGPRLPQIVNEQLQR